MGLVTQTAAGDEVLTPLALGLRPDISICNLDLHGSGSQSNLRRYFEMCKEAGELLVITSCFAVWKQGKFKNGCAKVIPAVPVSGPGSEEDVCVFFFDDNINLHLGTTVGAADAKGICNLQNTETGAYVDFSVGQNGFKRDRAYRHTLIHHSSEYRNVLVQANILEAITNVDYFTSIIEKYSRPREKIIVYMDVNGTILWDDSIMGLGPAQVLLSTMFGLMEIRPRAACEYAWDDSRSVRLEEKPQILKQLVQDIAGGDSGFYHDFWRIPNCERLIGELCQVADVSWTLNQQALTPEEFVASFERYHDELQSQSPEHGLTASWFRCVSSMKQAGHSLVITSFGMDTRRVVLMSVGDERKVPHIAINFELWSERDSSRFVEQFAHAEPPSRLTALNGPKKKPEEQQSLAQVERVERRASSWSEFFICSMFGSYHCCRSRQMMA